MKITILNSTPCRSRTALVLGLSLLSACAAAPPVITLPPPPPVAQTPPPPPPPPTTPDAEFRHAAPAPGETRAWSAPAVTEFRLANQMRVLLVEEHSMPTVTVRLVARRAGSESNPANRSGLASLTGLLLEGGTQRRNAIQLSDEFESIGAEHAVNVEFDTAAVSVRVLSAHVNRALDLLADMVQNPAFPQDELDRQRGRRVNQVAQEADSPSQVASHVTARVLFGNNSSYGYTQTGTAAALQAITRTDVQNFWRQYYAPSECALVVVGDVTRATLEPELQRLWGRWNPRTPRIRPLTAPTVVNAARRVVVVNRPNTPQATVVVAHAGVARNSPDYAPLLVMNTILGGMFSSRINLNLREAHAWTYGARSAFAFRHHGGPFVAGGQIRTPHAVDAVREIFSEINRMRTTDVTADELAAAQARLADSLPAAFEGTEQASGAVASIFVHGLPLDEFQTLVSRVRAVTVADVHRVAERYLTPNLARVIFVGDRNVISQNVATLELGEIEDRTPFAEPVANSGSTAAPGSAATPAATPATRPAARP